MDENKRNLANQELSDTSLSKDFLNTVFPELELSSSTLDYVKYYDNVLSSVPDVTDIGHVHKKEFINHQRL